MWLDDINLVALLIEIKLFLLNLVTQSSIASEKIINF